MGSGCAFTRGFRFNWKNLFSAKRVAQQQLYSLFTRVLTSRQFIFKRTFSERNFSGFQTRGFWKGKGWSLANFSCSFQWRGPPSLLEGPRRPVNAKSLNLLLAWLVFSYQEGGWTETPAPTNYVLHRSHDISALLSSRLPRTLLIRRLALLAMFIFKLIE